MKSTGLSTNAAELARHCSTPLIQKLSFALAVSSYPFSLTVIIYPVVKSVLTSDCYVSRYVSV
jgi:hypothetical protein